MERNKGGCCKKVKEQNEELKALRDERDVLKRQLIIAFVALDGHYKFSADPIRANDAIDRIKLIGPIP